MAFAANDKDSAANLFEVLENLDDLTSGQRQIINLQVKETLYLRLCAISFPVREIIEHYAPWKRRQIKVPQLLLDPLEV